MEKLFCFLVIWRHMLRAQTVEVVTKRTKKPFYLNWKKTTLLCSSLESNEHSTKPPARFEASLVKELEEKGIGRPSTLQNYSRLLDGLMLLERGQTYPTFLGLAVTQLLENHFNSLVDNQFTATMEDGLDAISRGELDSLPFMKEFYFGSKIKMDFQKCLKIR